MGAGNPSNANTPQAEIDRVNAPLGMEATTAADGGIRGGVGSIGACGGAMESVLVRTLREQVAELKAHNQLLQSLLDRQSLLAVPRVCEWTSILPHMRVLPKQLMLGLDPEKNRMRPREEHVKEAILDSFDVGVDDTCLRKQFDNAWTAGLKTKVGVHISNRRGRFSTNARTELWRLLGVPKPVNGSAEELERWRARLLQIYTGEYVLYIWLQILYSLCPKVIVMFESHVDCRICNNSFVLGC